ncbi:MAG TPA: glycosyltransferase [Gemmataceae bacterium]|jgi:glycosyltransferase involved in cell wall biosynthesis
MRGAVADKAGVTIAVPNWNHELVLARAIAPALRAVADLAAEGVPAEVLVIDDGSRDGSVTLLRQLEALHYPDGLRVLALRHNSGLARARNRALAECAYRHVLYLDADNELVPGNVSLFYRAAVRTGAAAVYGTLLRNDARGLSAMSNESIQFRLFENNYVDAFALFDADQLRDLGGYADDDRVRTREDWELLAHLACNGREVVFVPVVLGYYHDTPGSMIKDSLRRHKAQAAHVKRVFNQLDVRSGLPLNTLHKRYHPDVGYF